MLWLGMHFPALTLEIFAPEEESETAPQVVVEDHRVIFCNASAAAAGITTGSSLATAHSIVRGLRHHRRNPDDERRQLQRLAEGVYRFSSQVSPAPPDGLVAEIGASLRLFGDSDRLCREATALCQDLGHRVVCRTAPTPLAALSLARADVPTLEAVPLRCAAVEPACLPPAIIEQLADMGVHTIGQLVKLPAADLGTRFGRGLVDWLARLTGTAPDPRRYVEPPARFRRQLHLLSPVRSKEALLAGPMTQLLTELQHWLIAHQLVVEQLRWRFVGASRDAAPTLLRVRFSADQQRAERLLEISRLELERAVLPEEVIGLGLRAEQLRRWQGGSRALFGYLTQAQMTELGELVDRLEARLGQGSCWSPRALDQHVPEAAWHAVPPLRAGKTGASAGRRPPPSVDGTRRQRTRPVWLFEPPRAIEARQLTLLRGPERIGSGWWSDRPATAVTAPDAGQDWRDYYVARLENGTECWVFVDAASRWHLHGYFG